MRFTTILGILLIVAGALALVYEEISYTTEEHVAEIGPVEATVEETESIPLPQVGGGIALAAGVILLVVGRRRD